MSLFICPVCLKPLNRLSKAYICKDRHSFDISSQGYVHLLKSSCMNSSAPGDDKNMVVARNIFLNKGYYSALSQAIDELSCLYTGDFPLILDSGCGEGYYTANMENALKKAGKSPSIAGIDISKHAVKYAAKKSKNIEFAVASAFHMPIADNSIELLLNCFSPLAIDEFNRVMKKDGYFLYVAPGPMHLWQLKKQVYEKPYPNEHKIIEYDGFSYIGAHHVEQTIYLENHDDIEKLFMMTPYFWKTPKSGRDKLKNLNTLTTDIEFYIYIYKKK